MGKCHERIYDFLHENNDYKAVLSYMPNFFSGGHYHAYLKKDGNVLDIASNVFCTSMESIDKILCGKVITELTNNISIYGSLMYFKNINSGECLKLKSDSESFKSKVNSENMYNQMKFI